MSALPRQIVYLAGPMSGLPFSVVSQWRDKATDFLEGLKDARTKEPLYHVLNPLRGRPQEKADDVTFKPSYSADAYTHTSAEKQDIARDRYDVLRAHIILADLTDAEKIGKPSIGTIFEMCWGYEFEKFIIAVMSPSNPHWHTFIKHAASIIVPTLDEAMDYMANVLNVSEA